MIEVEKKFILDESQQKRLLDGAEFQMEKTLADTYFDTSDLALGRSNRWLRSRNGKFELKIPVAAVEPGLFNEYHELESENEIRVALKLLGGKSLVEALVDHNYLPQATMVTTRKEYKKEGFTIDLNEFDFGYQIVEIELMVSGESEVESARRRIADFAVRHQLTMAPVRGKLFEYWRRFKPELYQLLDKQ